MTNLNTIDYVIRVNQLVDKLIDAQENQQKTISELLQSVQDYADFCAQLTKENKE